MSSSEDSASRARELPLTIEAEAPRARERRRPDYLILAGIGTLLSAAAFLYYWRSGELLLYGDAVAHLNIARRVLDSRLPGFFQFGTVWLPLPHILMQPLIWSTWMWKTGLAGSIPSMIAYVAGVVGIFRLVISGLSFLPNHRREARFAAWFGALIYALNPNLLYLQSTAMTEPLYLALFIWATVFLADFRMRLLSGDDRHSRWALVKCGVLLLLAIMTRYDGWFAAIIYAGAAILMLVAAGRRSGLPAMQFLFDRAWRRSVLAFVFLLAIAPIGWFIFNKYEFKDPLAFVRGPYSARGIEARTRQPDQPRHPGWESPSVGATYFLKSAKLNVAASERAERVWMYAALLGTIFVMGFIRPLWSWLLLWLPVPFYAISMAWGGVPIFLPVWWPFSYYNVRYGIQLLPVFVVFGAGLLYLFMRRFNSKPMKIASLATASVLVLIAYLSIWQSVPVSLREARVNSADRIALESQLTPVLEKLPADSTLLMFLGKHGGALQQVGFPLKRTINECHKRIWESALLSPAWMADFVVATDGDPIANAVNANPEGLEKVMDFSVPRQPRITLYRSTIRQ